VTPSSVPTLSTVTHFCAIHLPVVFLQGTPSSHPPWHCDSIPVSSIPSDPFTRRLRHTHPVHTSRGQPPPINPLNLPTSTQPSKKRHVAPRSHTKPLSLPGHSPAPSRQKVLRSNQHPTRSIHYHRFRHELDVWSGASASLSFTPVFRPQKAIRFQGFKGSEEEGQVTSRFGL